MITVPQTAVACSHLRPRGHDPTESEDKSVEDLLKITNSLKRMHEDSLDGRQADSKAHVCVDVSSTKNKRFCF